MLPVIPPYQHAPKMETLHLDVGFHCFGFGSEELFASSVPKNSRERRLIVSVVLPPQSIVM